MALFDQAELATIWFHEDMTKATTTDQRFVTEITAGSHSLLADTTWQGSGGDAGMSPHALLESSLAACIAMTVRIAADRRSTPLESATVEVIIDESDSNAPRFECRLTLNGSLSDQERAGLLRVAHHCPIGRLLSRSIPIEISLT